MTFASTFTITNRMTCAIDHRSYRSGVGFLEAAKISADWACEADEQVQGKELQDLYHGQ